MDAIDLARQAKQIIAETKSCPDPMVSGMHAKAAEFLRNYGGPKNAFLATLEKMNPMGYAPYVGNAIVAALTAFASYVDDGLYKGLSPERQAQIDVVSDFLEQAQALLDSAKVHPAPPAMIIGAALEEFLRNWVEAEGLNMGDKRPSIDSYAKTLREANLISKQDKKDIDSWAGTRNHAAHGEWEQIGDKARVRLMLEGINLFMRKYTPSS